MICIVCKRPIEHSYGAPGLIGCYCQYCATAMKLTPEQILKSQYEQAIKELTEEIARLKTENERLKAMRTIDERYKFCNIIGDAYIYTKTLEDYNKLRADFRIDTVRMFAERLKKFYGNFKGVSHGYAIEYHIDQIAEELRKEIQDAAHK